MIVPGFVNAHSHLEYAVYAGFGDGLPFGPWLATHIERKGRARLRRTWSRSRGSASPTRSPPGSRRRPTTASRARPRPPPPSSGCARSSTSRCSRSDPADARRGSSTEKRARVAESRARADRGLAARAVHLLARRLPVVPVARHPGRHPPRGERERERVARARRGPLDGDRADCSSRRPAKRAVATLEPVLGPDLLCAHCVEVDDEEIALLAERGVAVAHCPRSNALLGCGVAPLAELRAAGVARRARHRLARLDALVRRLRGDAGGDLRRAGPRAAPRRAARGRARSRLATLGGGPRSANRRRGGYPDARQARRPGGRVARREPLPSGGGSRGGGRLRRLAGTSARDDRRRRDPLPKRRTRTSGERYAAPQAPPGAECSRRIGSGGPREAEAAAVAGGAVLPAAPQPREVGVRASSRSRSRSASCFFGVGSGSTGISDVLQSAFNFGSRAAAPRSRSLQKKVAKNPQNATAWRDLATALRAEAADAGGRQRAASATRALQPEGRHGASRSSRRSTGPLATTTRPTTQNAQQRGRAAGVARTRRSRRPRRRPLGKAFGDPNGAAGPDLGRGRRQLAHGEAADAPTRTTRARRRNAEAAYKKLGRAAPERRDVQIQLGQAAQAAGDTATAIAAYRRS